MPNLINDYFSGIGPLLASKIPQRPNVIQIAGVANREGLELGEFHYEELLKCVKEISIYKSSGIINLSTRFFKDTMLCIPNVFLHLYNLVRDTSIFPNDWKKATVVPLPKCNNPSDPSELRPVSLLPILGKIIEKLIHGQMSMFFEISQFLSQYQHGFRKGFSTTSATAKFLDEIAMGLDNGNYTIAVFLDIKKAFDTIDHRIIIEKLKHAGIGPRTLSLFSNYLQGWKQGVLYDGLRSNIRPLLTGVPQGSTLGPLLFLICEWLAADIS